MFQTVIKYIYNKDTDNDKDTEKMKNEVIALAINDSFYSMCTDYKTLKDIHYGALSEAIVIGFELGVINSEELRFLNGAAREAYLSN